MKKFLNLKIKCFGTFFTEKLCALYSVVTCKLWFKYVHILLRLLYSTIINVPAVCQNYAQIYWALVRVLVTHVRLKSALKGQCYEML